MVDGYWKMAGASDSGDVIEGGVTAGTGAGSSILFYLC